MLEVIYNFSLNEVYVVIVFLIAGLVHGVVGFAFALISTPLLTLFIPIDKAILLTIIPTIWANIFSTLHIKNSKNLIKENLTFFMLIIIGSIMGTLLLFIVSPILFNILLILLIWLYLYLDFKKNIINLNIYSRTYNYIIGLLAGISAGLSNIMSPILLIYFLSTKKSKKEIILLSNLAFLLAKLTQFTIFIKYKSLTKEYIVLTCIIVLAITISLYFGKKIGEHQLVSANYTKIVKVFIFIISLILLNKTLIT